MPDARALPHALEEIADIIGEAAALRLAQARGGTRVYIPHDPTPGCVLAQIVGLDAAHKLARLYAGDRPEIPQAARLKNKRARILREDGSQAAIARRVKCSERYVRMVKSHVAPDDRQADLFPDPADD